MKTRTYAVLDRQLNPIGIVEAESLDHAYELALSNLDNTATVRHLVESDRSWFDRRSSAFPWLNKPQDYYFNTKTNELTLIESSDYWQLLKLIRSNDAK